MKDWILYTITLLLFPLFLIYWWSWWLIKGRKGHGDIILYHDGVENF